MKNITFVLIFIWILPFHGQSKKVNQFKPLSIYTLSSKVLDMSNSYSSLNEKLKLSDYQFVIVNQLDIELNQISINSRNLGRTPTQWIHDDYFKYRDEHLLKGFTRKYDATRWNSWCPNPLSVYVE